MRDPKRIPRILDLLREVWEMVPDWRLGQLVANLHAHVDVFHPEDDKTEHELLELRKRLQERAALDKPDEDQVLLGRSGAIHLFGSNGVAEGVTITKTGRQRDYETLEIAARRLVNKGLLTACPLTGDPVVSFRFTERGRIAHEALVELAKRPK